MAKAAGPPEGGREALAERAAASACERVIHEAWAQLGEAAGRVVDEEDGVFLFKLTRLSQAYPEVIQCVSERRAATVASLGSRLDPVRTSLVHRVQDVLFELAAAQHACWRQREAERSAAASAKLERQRVAAGIEAGHREAEAALRARRQLLAMQQQWEAHTLDQLHKVSARADTPRGHLRCVC